METIVYGEDAEGIKKVSRVKNHSSCLFRWPWDSSRSSGPKRIKCSGGSNHRRSESSSERVYYFIGVRECQTKVAPAAPRTKQARSAFSVPSGSRLHSPTTHPLHLSGWTFSLFYSLTPRRSLPPHTPDLWNVNGIFKTNFHSIKINVIKLIPYIYL